MTTTPANEITQLTDDPIVRELRYLQFPLVERLAAPDCVVEMLETLRRMYSPELLRKPTADRTWELVGLYFMHRGRVFEALSIFWSLYDQMLLSQEGGDRRHKGMPLCWICDCYASLGFAVHAKRYLMLTLCEDALREKGNIIPAAGGVYFRAVWRHGISDAEFHSYAKHFFELSQKFERESVFPEALLQRLESDWLTETPSAAESGTHKINHRYLHHLMNGLGDSTGKSLELLAQYLMDCMPGCRTIRRARTPSTDYDLVCSVDGPELDFRSEFGRYFLCECKDWNTPADFTAIAKFCRVLDSVKARFGVIFSDKGVSGELHNTDAKRELLKYFQGSGKVIVVIDRDDLEAVLKGGNFIRLLRRKYETVRLDLREA